MKTFVALTMLTQYPIARFICLLLGFLEGPFQQYQLHEILGSSPCHCMRILVNYDRDRKHLGVQIIFVITDNSLSKARYHANLC